MSRQRVGARLAPYLLALPAWLWLVIFFVVPAVVMLSVSTMRNAGRGGSVYGMTRGPKQGTAARPGGW